MVLVGNSPRDCGPGGQWLGFIFIWWGIVLMGSCPRTGGGIIIKNGGGGGHCAPKFDNNEGPRGKENLGFVIVKCLFTMHIMPCMCI